MPADWAERLDLGLIEPARNWRAMGEDFVAPLRCDRSCRVTVRAARDRGHDVPSAESDTKATMEGLRYARSVVRRYEQVREQGMVFTLEEYTEGSLEGELAKYRGSAYGIRNIPLQVTLPLLVEVLRGVRDLEVADLVHCDLNAWTIRVVGGHALLGSLDKVVPAVRDGRPKSDLKLESRRALQPPESKGGEPSDPSCNMWAVGRLWAHMHMKDDPVEEQASLVNPLIMSKQVWQVGFQSVGEGVHEVLAENFDVRLDPIVRNALDPIVRYILVHLLDRDPAQRWTAEQALEEVYEIADREGIDIPPMRELKSLPPCWFDAPRHGIL